MRKKKSLRILKSKEGKFMQINNYNPRTSFGEKYPTHNLIACACKNPFIRKSDVVNLATSLLKLTKNEKTAMIRDEVVYHALLKKTGEYILTQVPGLKSFTEQINKLPEAYHKTLLKIADEKLGEEIDIKRLVRSQSARRNKLWIYDYETEN